MKILLFANTDWYLFNFRLSLATALRSAGHDVVLVSPPGRYGPRLEALGFRWLPIQMKRRSLNPLTELRVLWELVRLLRREKPSIVHAFTIKSAIYASIAGRISRVSGRVAAVTGLGYVFTSRQALARLLRPIVIRLMRFSFGGRGSRVVLQNNDDLALLLQNEIVPPGSIRLISGSGVDCSRFVPKAPGEAHAQPRVLLAARLVWDKGIAEYADAARLLALRCPDAQFLLAGDPDEGNPAAVPRDVLTRWKEEGRLDWIGHVDDMAHLLRSVDLVVLPSYREGLPRGLIEAAACALPIVTSDVPGCRDVVVHAETGLLVSPGNAQELADAIARLLEDPEFAAQLGKQARDRTLERFSDRTIISQTLNVYAELVPGVWPEDRGLVWLGTTSAGVPSC